MTTVRSPHRFARSLRVEGQLRWAILVCLTLVSPAAGQDGPVHWMHAGAMPPGAIGRQRQMRGGPLSRYCQPVEIRAPKGARISPAAGSAWGQGQLDRLLVGLAIGPVYRFPVPVDLTEEELLLAAEGKFVTRVIYLEDPQLAIPIDEKPGDETRWVEVRPGEDPLVTADALGRPMAILRIGGRLPEAAGADAAFVYGAPPAVVYPAPPAKPPTRPRNPSAQ